MFKMTECCVGTRLQPRPHQARAMSYYSGPHCREVPAPKLSYSQAVPVSVVCLSFPLLVPFPQKGFHD